MKNKNPNFKKLSKKIIPSKTRKKIKKIKDKEDRMSLYEHSMKSNLEMLMYDFEKKLKKIKDKDKHFHLLTKISLLKNKVKLFLINHDKEDKKQIMKQIKSIKKDI